MDTSPSEVTVFIGVGSSIDPRDSVTRAFDMLSHAVAIEEVSTFYRNPAIGRPNEPEFLNGVFRIRTARRPRTLKFDILRVVEDQLGRHRTSDKFGPRTIDLDILLYGDVVVAEPDLNIPDPDIRSRPSVAVPLAEIATGVVMPDTREPVGSLAASKLREGLKPDYSLTRILRLRLGHESGTCGGTGA